MKTRKDNSKIDFKGLNIYIYINGQKHRQKSIIRSKYLHWRGENIISERERGYVVFGLI